MPPRVLALWAKTLRGKVYYVPINTLYIIYRAIIQPYFDYCSPLRNVCNKQLKDRPLLGIAICVVYHPPGLPEQDHYLLNEYFINSADILRNQYPNCGLIFLGDFNDFQASNLLSRHNLKQLVLTPTTCLAILDLIIANLSNFYEAP